MDPVSKRTADSSSRRSISHPFVYHGMPFLLELVFRAWQLERVRPSTSAGHCAAGPSLPLQDFHPVIQAQFLGVQCPETCGWSPAWNGDQLNGHPTPDAAGFRLIPESTAAGAEDGLHHSPQKAWTRPQLEHYPPGYGTVVGLCSNAASATPPLGFAAPCLSYPYERTRQEGSVALVPRAA